LAAKGHKVAILDADVTGPSIPQAFGLTNYQAVGDEDGIFPGKSEKGIAIMSANLLVDTPATPIVWRGPMISSLVQQMYSNVIYGEMEFLLIDMPPGTGDVPLTVFQQIPIDGVIVVSSPQELVSMVVEKSVNMAKMMKVNLLGLVENMAYAKCPHCGEKIDVFGTGDFEAWWPNATASRSSMNSRSTPLWRSWSMKAKSNPIKETRSRRALPSSKNSERKQKKLRFGRIEAFSCLV
jgi:Mrp family chromosome partitioning ATPase